MIKEYNEEEFIAEYGEKEYNRLAQDAYLNMISLPEYKNNEPYVYGVMSFEMSENEHVMVTADIKKTDWVDDFGLRRIAVSDQQITDELLDEYNRVENSKKDKKVIVETNDSKNKILNKNLLHFNVKGAIDFSENLYIEMYADEEVGSEKVPINDFLEKINEAYPNLFGYFRSECFWLKTDHHFNVKQRSIWVICKHHYRHSHEGFNSKGKTTKHNFDDAIKLLNDHSGFEIEILGHRLDNQVEDLEKYYQGDVERYVYVDQKTVLNNKIKKIKNT